MGMAAVPFERPLVGLPQQLRQTGNSKGFFAYHGIWAPGVRLFRRLAFAPKAILISAVFIIPYIGSLGFQAVQSYNQGLDSRKAATRQHVEVA
jgi:methyl-accepting chemotaxis protein